MLSIPAFPLSSCMALGELLNGEASLFSNLVIRRSPHFGVVLWTDLTNVKHLEKLCPWKSF